MEHLYEAHKQEIEIICARPLAEVASASVPLKPMSQTSFRSRLSIKEIRLKLDENIVDWFEYRLEDGESLDEVLGKALIDHIRWLSSPWDSQQEEKVAGKSAKSP